MNNRLTPIALLAAGLVIAGAVLLRPGTSQGQPLAGARAASAAADASRYLSFTGDATIKLKPDTASIDVTVDGTGATSQAALADGSQKMTAVIAALKALTDVQIADDDLQTSGGYTYEDTDRNVWHNEQSLSVTVHDVSKAGIVIGAANAAGADNVDGPSFSVADQRDAYRQALRAAIEDARSKADAAAEAMGVKVSGVISVNEQSQSQGPIAFSAASAGTATPSSTPPVQSGTLDVDASVTVSFAYSG